VTRGPDGGILAEIASFQMEYTALAQASGKKEHYEKVHTIPCFIGQIT
jgi:mannosyl-oligosaccharide alpha-1,2-mannosidase